MFCKKLVYHVSNEDEKMVLAWYYNTEDETDPREPHQFTPNRPISMELLDKVGVLQFYFNPETELDKVKDLMKERNYSSSDQVTISKEKLSNYEEKLKMFFTEHIHDDEEIRYIMEGSGYFDIRDNDDKWMRIACQVGDMIILPAGSYHRFILDSNNYVKAMRLFKDDVNWTPINRGEEADNHHIRKKYLETLKKTFDLEEDEDEATSKRIKLSDASKLDVPAVLKDKDAHFDLDQSTRTAAPEA